MYESQERIKTLKRALQDPKDSFGQRSNLGLVFFLLCEFLHLKQQTSNHGCGKGSFLGLQRNLAGWKGVFVKGSDESAYLIPDSYEAANRN